MPTKPVFRTLLAVALAGLALLGLPSAAGADDTGSVQVYGRYTPIAGDFDGDTFGDILFYAPGTAADSLWLGDAEGWQAHTTVPKSITGTYVPVVGDFNGDQLDDILFHPAGGGTDFRWLATGEGGFSSSAMPNANTGTPLVGRFNGDERDDILWYAPGSAADSIWVSREDGTFQETAMPINGTYTAVVGDFDGNASDDVLFGNPGAAAEPLWLSTGAVGLNCATCFTKTSRPFTGTGTAPHVGDFDGNGFSDVLWYGAGTGTDELWLSGPGAAFTSSPLSVVGMYSPVIREDYSHDQVVWYSPGGTDLTWTYEDGAFVNGEFPQVGPGLVPLVGVHRGPFPDEDIFFYGPGTTTDVQTYVTDDIAKRRSPT